MPQVHSDRELPVGLLRTAQLARIGDLAAASVLLEAEPWPKPGLVSHVDCGSHSDMDARTFRASALALHPFFVALASAGGTGMDELRAIGLLAEQAMIAATGGVNTHRGAIFGLGLLCAADLQMPYLVASAPYTDMTWRERRQRMLWSDR